MAIAKSDHKPLSSPSDFKEDNNDKSASTISDCYSDDDEYKEGIMQDYNVNQAAILLSHESVAFDGDQVENIPLCTSNRVVLDKTSTEENNSYNYININHDENLSSSFSHIPSQIQKIQSPELLYGKCLSEFYRPPSRSKNSFIGWKHISENASISSRHYVESSLDTTKTCRNPQMFIMDNLSNANNNRNARNMSTSLFNCSTQSQTCNGVSNDDSTIKLISSISLNSKTQSESVDQLYNTENSNNFFLDCTRMNDCQHQMENSTHSVLFRKPKSRTTIKSTTAQSTNKLHEQMTQTNCRPRVKEKCVGTIKFSPAVENKPRYESGDIGDSLVNSDFAPMEGFKDVNLSRNLFELMHMLQKHINTVTAHLKRSPINQSLISMDTDQVKDKIEEPIRFPHTYSHLLVIDLYKQIKHMYSQLDTQLKYGSKDKIPTRHQRHYSELVTKRYPLYENGDFNQNQEFDLDMFDNRTKNPIVKPAAPVQLEPDVNDNDDQRDWINRVFELSPYDDLIKSYQSNTDRRIKAVGNRMKCKIIIEGPFRLYDSTNGCWNMRNKIAYRCYLNGHTKEAVDKCLKCLQDTFPQSCLNEKHVVCRLESKLIS